MRRTAGAGGGEANNRRDSAPHRPDDESSSSSDSDGSNGGEMARIVGNYDLTQKEKRSKVPLGFLINVDSQLTNGPQKERSFYCCDLFCPHPPPSLS